VKRAPLIVALFLLTLAACAPAGQGPTATPIRIDTGIDPSAWARVPASKFLKGQHEHQTLVDYDYEIMVTDVTNEQYAGYLNEALEDSIIKLASKGVVGYYPGDVFHNHHHEEEIEAGEWLHMSLNDEGLRLSFDGKSFSSISGYENHPMALVTWFGAKAYCKYYGWRLPTEEEWEKAARGFDGRPFPWGDSIEPNNANYYSSHDLFEKMVAGLGETTPVGFYNGQSYDGYQTLDSPSPYGLYDMAGNVWQWAGDVYEGTHYRYMRGGSKADYAYNLRIWTRNNARPDYYSPNVGFRCARDVLG